MVPHLTGPPSHWSPISLVPQLAPTHRPFQWSPISLVPHPIGPFSPAGPQIHKSPPHCLNSMAPFSLVPPCNPFYPVLIGPPSHRSHNVTLVIQFSLVPHLISPPNVILVIQFSLFPHLIGLSPQSNPFYPVLIGPPSHLSPNVILVIQLSLVPHLIGPPV